MRVLVMFSIDPEVLTKFQKKVPKHERSELISKFMVRYCDGRVKIL